MSLFGTFMAVLTGKPVDGETQRFFGPLDGLQAGLATDVARYVATGEGGSVLSILSQATTQAHWTGQPRTYPRETPGLALLAAGRLEPLMRLGEAMAALEPLGAASRWAAHGTPATPDWLRHAVSCAGHAPRDTPLCPVDQLALLAQTGGVAPVPVVLDLLFHAGPGIGYDCNNSLERFGDADQWLRDHADAVSAASAGLDAPGRVELLRAIGRFGLADAYLPMLVEAGLASAKTVRTAATTGLTGADGSALATALDARYGTASPATRAELVRLAADTLGPAATSLLTGWQAAEADKRPREAIERALATLALDASGAEADAGPGYRAVDGSFVALSPAPAPPGWSVIPDEVYALLRPAIDGYNERTAALKAAHRDEKGHWTRSLQPIPYGALKAWRPIIEATGPLQGNTQRQNLLNAVQWPQGQKDTGGADVAAFYAHPAVTMRHVIAVLRENAHWSLMSLLAGTWQHAAAQELRRRVRTSADFRTAAALWVELGGRPPAVEYLQGSYGVSLGDLDGDLLWEHVAEQLDMVDEALGLKPSHHRPEFQPGNALDLLGVLPRTPQRHLLPLLALATGSAKALRSQARALLADAPDIDGLIAGLLADGRQEVRAGAAEWLAARRTIAAIPALRTALAKEKSDAARAALITALAGLGDDVSDCFDPAALATEASKGLAKTGAKGLDWFPFDGLPALHWRDGDPVAPAVARWWVVLANKLKQPGGNALLDLWLDRLAPADANAFGLYVLRSWLHHDTARPSDEEANAYAAANVGQALQHNRQQVAQHPQYAAYYPTDHDLLFAQFKRDKASQYLGSASDNRGLLALATRAAGADAAQAARAFLKEHGARIAQAKALLDTLAANPSPAALQVVLAVAERFKARTVQDHAAALVERIAERNGWTPAELADRTVPTAGLDARSEAALDCGEGRSCTLRLDADDALVLIGPMGKPTKTLPTPRTDDDKPLIAAAKKQLATAKKEVKQAFATQTDRLYEAMCVERRWPTEDWRTHLLAHPIVGRLLQRLVWIGHAGDRSTPFRPTEDGGFTDAADEPVDMATFDAVQLAHAGLMTPAAADEWRTHLADYEVRQPFEQFAADLPDLSTFDKRATTIADRRGWMIETFKLRGAATKLGFARAAAADGGVFTAYERRYDAVGLVAQIAFTGSPLPEENIAAALYELSFVRARRGGWHGAAVPLGEVPPVLLAESWRALHRIAAAGTGYDAEWEKKAAW